MVDFGMQQPVGPADTHLILHDGACGLCSRLVQFVLRHDRRGVFSFAALQSAVGRSVVASIGGRPDDLTSFYVVADYRSAAPRVFTRSDAALFVASALPWPWRAARFLRFVPSTIRNAVYDAVARHRYRVFGRDDQCLIPSAEFNRRFIDRR